MLNIQRAKIPMLLIPAFVLLALAGCTQGEAPPPAATPWNPFAVEEQPVDTSGALTEPLFHPVPPELRDIDLKALELALTPGNATSTPAVR
jgi:hypothetical protein